MNNDQDHKTDFSSEGDLNTSNNRNLWTKRHISGKGETEKLLAEDATYFLHQSLSTPCLNVLERSVGATITDIEGRTYLDFHGNYIHNVGFGHPKIIEAITQQLKILSFSTRRYTNKKAIELAKSLTTKATDPLSRVLFAPGGAEAIGMALKIARMATGRHKTISMWDSFHGASLDTISIGGEAIFRNNIGPLLPGTEHVPPPNPSECPFKCGKSCSSACADYVEYVLEKEGDVAAVIAETVRSAPFIPPKKYWKKIRAACDKYGALLILDEIPHALGRTGKWFTFEHYDIVPDMVVIGKALGGGIFPLAALIAREELNDVVKNRSIGHFTHEKNPVAAAAALALIEVIETESLLEVVTAKQEYCLVKMHEIQKSCDWVYDVRAMGLLMGIELRNPKTVEKAKDLADKVMYQCMEMGLSFKISMGCIINLTPPMNVSFEELDTAFSIITNALNHVLAKYQHD